MLCYNLEKEGFRTAVASTGEDALNRLNVEIPAIVILDWMLPERSSREPRSPTAGSTKTASP